MGKVKLHEILGLMILLKLPHTQTHTHANIKSYNVVVPKPEHNIVPIHPEVKIFGLDHGNLLLSKIATLQG